MGAGKANLFGLVFLIPFIIFMGLPYYFLWPEQFTLDQVEIYLAARDALSTLDFVLVFFTLFMGIVAHELLHGIGWVLFIKNGWNSISFGMVWQYLTPYCHCKEVLSIGAYRFGSMLPALVLGIFPFIVALVYGNIILMAFAFFFTVSAGGDFLILWLLRNEKSGTMVLDHPEKIGCIVYQHPSN